MNLKKGQKLDSGFTVVDVVDLREIQATGVWARHDRCGAEVFHVVNDDSENLFAFAFATPPQDSTGVAHILEHAVLCGSENYPLKDAFIVLAQGSLQTFLNAMTYPDKTAYPASSVNEHDYFNLMSVYGDAVFRPLLSRWSFMQEGHRFEIARDESGAEKLSVTGVVYNEMKGAYSSLNAYADLWVTKSVLPDTAYDFDFGGSPDSIPDLTWEGLKDFHKKRYSPANCRVFLAGNIPTEKQLDFLSANYFSAFAQGEGGEAAPRVESQPRWTAPVERRIPCPSAGDDVKPTVFVSWLCTHVTDVAESIALSALSSILLGHDGSPLLKALIESGLGEDASQVSGLDASTAEAVFSAGLRGVRIGAEKEVEALVLGELRRLADEGIPPKEIEAALLAVEFSQREIKRSGGPFSLVWMARSLRAWMHGCKPWDSLLLEPSMEAIRRNLAGDSRYFESLIRKYLLDNPHRAFVVMEPQTDFLSKQEARLEEKMAGMLRGLSAEEKRSIIDMSARSRKARARATPWKRSLRSRTFRARISRRIRRPCRAATRISAARPRFATTFIPTASATWNSRSRLTSCRARNTSGFRSSGAPRLRSGFPGWTTRRCRACSRKQSAALTFRCRPAPRRLITARRIRSARGSSRPRAARWTLPGATGCFTA